MMASARMYKAIWLISILEFLLIEPKGLVEAHEKKVVPEIYFIAVSAKLDDCLPRIQYGDKHEPTCRVIVKGVTNLPVGSLLKVHFYDYIGQGSHIFDDGETVIVQPTGEFMAMVCAKSGLKMRANLQCNVTFSLDLDQPENVVEQIGQRGENIKGPQRARNAGGYYLEAITVVLP